MRVTFVAPHAGYSGGIRVIGMHAEGLKRRGHEVVVVSQPLPTLSLKDRVRLAIKGQKKPEWMSSHGGHLDGTSIRHRVLDRVRPVTEADVPDADIVIATWWETAEWVWRMPSSKGAKAFFIQGDESDLCKDDATRERLAEAWRLPMTKLAVAGWLVEIGRTRCPGQAIALVPNAVDLARFRAEPRGKQAVPTVGLIYSNAHLKGTDIMLGAYELARKQVPALRLVAFGDSPADGGPAWPGDVPFEVRPAQDRIPALYASCDAWLFGTRREGFGLPILEAMACRTPVIGTPAGAAPELIGRGGGILVREEDPADMAAAIVRVAGMGEAEWRAMSDAAYRIASSYSWDDATAQFEAVLVRATRDRGARAVNP